MKRTLQTLVKPYGGNWVLGEVGPSGGSCGEEDDSVEYLCWWSSDGGGVVIDVGVWL